MEIVNQVMLAGNLTEQPPVSDAGGRQFCPRPAGAALELRHQGRTVEHRQSLPITFFGEGAIVAKSFQKGDNIHVTGQLIRREPRARADTPNTPREGGTIFEVHVMRAFRISANSKPESAVCPPVIPVAGYVSAKNTRIEGIGITPNVPASWSFKSAVSDEDNQLLITATQLASS